MRRYLKVTWHHDFPDEPSVLYSEIDAGYEIRKIDVYRDGTHDFADEWRSTGTTRLGEILVPTAEEINEDPEFSAVVISAEDFDLVWQRATQSGGAARP
jgi:hypothetical protein